MQFVLTSGILRSLCLHPASIQDRGPVLQASRRPFPFIRKVFADAGYQGPRVAEATSMAVEIVKRKPDQVGFAVQPRRWVVERFFAWISPNRLLWKDAEATIGSATAPLRCSRDDSRQPDIDAERALPWIAQKIGLTLAAS